jgi:hypothetical protein
MRLIIKLFIISLSLIGCHYEIKNDQNSIKVINLAALDRTVSIKISELGFEDITYIPLETKDNCLIPIIMDIKIGNNFFLVQCFTTILEFRIDGSFVTKIGTAGRGPNEFLVAHDLEIEPRNQDIYIVDGWAKKFYIYDYYGKPKRTFASPSNTVNFRFIGDYILCYSTNYVADIETSYNLIDTNGRVLERFRNKYYWDYKNTGTTVFDENLFYLFNRRLYKKEIYSDTIYLFDNMNFIPYFAIMHGERLLTTEARSKFDPLFLFENYISQKNLFEFGDYLYYEFSYDHRLYGLIGSKKNDFQVLVDPAGSINNDLDGGPAIWPKTIRDENTIITWITALDLKKHVASEAFIKSTPKYPEKKKELEKLADSLKETDNPVLVLVRLKK